MKIYIARHGETDSNKSSRLQGQRIDDELNASGIKQAEKLASELVGEKFDVIFSSPLKRAQQTAEIIAREIDVPIIESREIMERDFGEFSGKTWEEMKAIARRDDLREVDFALEYNYGPYGGESAKNVEERLVKFVDGLKKHYSDKKILIIAHGGIMKMAHHIFREKKLDKTPDNATIHEFDV